jgi:hypothetical protein
MYPYDSELQDVVKEKSDANCLRFRVGALRSGPALGNRIKKNHPYTIGLVDKP